MNDVNEFRIGCAQSGRWAAKHVQWKSRIKTFRPNQSYAFHAINEQRKKKNKNKERRKSTTRKWPLFGCMYIIAHCEHFCIQTNDVLWIRSCILMPSRFRNEPESNTHYSNELTSYPWQFKVPFFQRFTSKTGYFSAQTKSNQMNILHVDAIFNQETNETGQITCNSWYISYGIYIPTKIIDGVNQVTKIDHWHRDDSAVLFCFFFVWHSSNQIRNKNQYQKKKK